MEQKRTDRRKALRQQVICGRLALVAVVGLSLINQLLLLLGVNYHFWISAAVPYYLNWFCGQMGAGAFWRVAAGFAGVAVLVAYAACLVLSQRKREWMTLCLGLYGLDTLLLAIFSFTLLRNPASCLLEIGVHIGCLVLLALADRAAGQLSRMRRSPRRRPREREVAYE